MKLGEILSKRNLVDDEQLRKALKLQYKSGGKLGDILQSIMHISGIDYGEALAEHFNLEFINLLTTNIDLTLIKNEDRYSCFLHSAIPIHLENDTYTVAVSDPNVDKFKFIHEKWGKNAKIICATKLDILWALQKRFKDNYIDEAINDLVRHNIAYSSKILFAPWQIYFFCLLFSACTYSILFYPKLFLIAVNVVLTLSLSGILLYRLFLIILGMFLLPGKKKRVKHESSTNKDLPIYSILIPLYKEKAVTLRNLFHHINKLNYPKHKLDVKILVEEDDLETIAHLKHMSLPRSYEYIYVPPGEPRTKSKACNYGLKFVYGEFVTLYDAEDLPVANQLLEALKAFADNDDKLACVQCRLNFYNPNENWLTRMFTLEYSSWFDLMLPGLKYTRAPIPLGGTSNHFRTSILKKVNSWDPYNVTEDADLGIRLYALGYKTKVIASVTYEEANCRLINWIKQRTRWIKGYMQTYIVHMRKPFTTLRTLGLRGFMGFQLFFGGVVFSDLSYILVSILFVLILLPLPFDLSFLFPSFVRELAIVNFIVGTAGMIGASMITAFYRGNVKMILASFTSPVYWMLMSIASYRALFQLIFYPSYWDKTEHGISAVVNTYVMNEHE